MFSLFCVLQEYYVAFNEVDAQLKVRDLTSVRIGTLIRITGQVVRTHPVHPELVLGSFICADCQTAVSGVEQQFKYTQPAVCRNPVVSLGACMIQKCNFVNIIRIHDIWVALISINIQHYFNFNSSLILISV